MNDLVNIVGRTKEKNELLRLCDLTREGRGAICLISGEAGIGKSRLVENVLSHSGLKIFVSRLSDGVNPPYSCVTKILRTFLSETKSSKINCGPLEKYLPAILPELGEAPTDVDGETIKETMLAALLYIVSKKPAVFFFDDIQWSDSATIDLLNELGDRIKSEGILVICAYRNDEIAGETLVRKLRNNLRRKRVLSEINIEALTYEQTVTFISELTNEKLSKAVADKIYHHTNGLPLFTEEIVLSLLNKKLLSEKNGVLDFVDVDNSIPIPDSIKDTIINQTDDISDTARDKLEIASVAGLEFNIDLLIEISGNEDGIDELFNRNFLIESDKNFCRFKNVLIRETIRNEIAWSRRRSLHRKIASYLEKQNTYPGIIAEHWLQANEPGKARKQLINTVEQSCKIYAFDDAATAANKALENWPDNEDEEQRIELLNRYAQCKHMSGDLNEAIRALKEITENPDLKISDKLKAEAFRFLATLYGLKGSGNQSAEAREEAAKYFKFQGMLSESSAELLVAAAKYTTILLLDKAYEVANQAVRLAEESGRMDVKSESLGLLGNIMAMQGKFEDGKQVTQDALSFAIKNNLTDAASVIYRRLASTMEYASDYSSARETYYTAYDYCINEGKDVSAQICLGCMSYTLFQTGEWKRSLEICSEVINNKNTPEGSSLVGLGMMGIIQAFRGENKKAEKNLKMALDKSRILNITAAELIILTGLAIYNDFSDKSEESKENYISILNLWQKSQDRHDVILSFIWASYFFSNNSDEKELSKLTEALASIASQTGNPEALTGLSFALGERAMLNKEYGNAIEQYNRSAVHLTKLEVPLISMLVDFRKGCGYIGLKDKENALKYLNSSYRISKNLGTRPFSVRIEEKLSLLGVKGKETRKEDSSERKTKLGLTRRQTEILSLISDGLTNKEISEKLFLSTRTVDMHVSHILERLNCRSRIEAINKVRDMKTNLPAP